ncbi:MAG: tetratricopeptide repeat protein [Chloroflexota bacterium]|nr:tetratricopeptide repeat protein [Chloroflexota bacterium]
MIERTLSQFSLFLGPARLRALFLLIGVTGLFSLILNAVEGEWVIPVQTLLVIAAIAGSLIVILGKLDAVDRGRWLAILLPSFGALLLGVLVVPQFMLPLAGAAIGWIIAGMLMFRSRMPMNYRQAVRHLRKNEYSEAVKVMDEVIKDEPDKPEHYRFRAEVLRVWGKLDRAKRDYRRMTEIAPDSAVAFNGLAEVCLQAGDLREALTAAQRAAVLAPDEWVAMYNLGMIEDRLAYADETVTHLQNALALKVPDARHRLLIQVLLARAFARLGRPDEARGAVTELKKLRTGLDEWDTILKSEQAETLRAAIGADVEDARALISDGLDPMQLTLTPTEQR